MGGPGLQEMRHALEKAEHEGDRHQGYERYEGANNDLERGAPEDQPDDAEHQDQYPECFQPVGRHVWSSRLSALAALSIDDRHPSGHSPDPPVNLPISSSTTTSLNLLFLLE
jgi:hypothetical protein